MIELKEVLKEIVSPIVSQPDKVIIITLGDYVISFFGNAQAVDNFSSKLTTAYTSAVVFCDEPLV